MFDMSTSGFLPDWDSICELGYRFFTDHPAKREKSIELEVIP